MAKARPCIHGEVCKEWMQLTDSIVPLRATCPRGCIHYRPKPKKTVEVDGQVIEIVSDGKVRLSIGNE